MSVEERVWVAIWYEETKSQIEVQRRFQARFGRNRDAPQRASIRLWHENLFEHGNVFRRKSGSGRQRSSGLTDGPIPIGRRGPIEWPARSPDLTPLDFYLWGHLKDLVYARCPRTVEDLKNFIREAILEINELGLMNKVLLEFKRRMRLVIENGGSHIEHLEHSPSSIEEPNFDDDDVYGVSR